MGRCSKKERVNTQENREGNGVWELAPRKRSSAATPFIVTENAILQYRMKLKSL